MSIVYNIEDLKSELVGKIVNWLTVLDVYRNSNNRIVCECQCRCGVIKEYLLKVIRNGSIKSCGCFHKSKEFSDKCKEFCISDPDTVKQRSVKFKQWCVDNKDKLVGQGKRHSQWFKNNSDIVDDYRNRMIDLNVGLNKDVATYNRVRSIKTIIEKNNLSDKIYEDDLSDLLSGNITASDKIRTKCPLCNKFYPHNVRDIFNISECKLKRFRLCDDCINRFSTSAYEHEIADYISTFYNGELVRNSREIIPPLELDLYYPDKRIAVEFNGDYWHSNLFKNEDYHYNKLKYCLHSGIILVSIFESLWNSDKVVIKHYLEDLFNSRLNDLSFIDKLYINNNYPPYNIADDDINYIEYSYKFNNYTVFTSGLSYIK